MWDGCRNGGMVLCSCEWINFNGNLIGWIRILEILISRSLD